MEELAAEQKKKKKLSGDTMVERPKNPPTYHVAQFYGDREYDCAFFGILECVLRGLLQSGNIYLKPLANNRPAMEHEAEVKSVYVSNVPTRMAASEIGEEFKKFGKLKPNGVAIRNRKDIDVCYAFVEFEDISGVQNAIKCLNRPPPEWQHIPETPSQRSVASLNIIERSGIETQEETSAMEHEVEVKSVYVRNVPTRTATSEIGEDLKKFGKCKADGVAIRTRKDIDVCYAFVEFEDISEVQNAIKVAKG